jgi:hypothetical protein
MKISDVTLNEQVEKRDRNLRIEIDCQNLAGDYTLLCTREVVLVKDGKRLSSGGANGERVYSKRRMLSEIAATNVTIGEVTLTGAQIAAYVEALSDVIAQEAD